MLFHHGSTNGHYIKSTFRKTIYYTIFWMKKEAIILVFDVEYCSSNSPINGECDNVERHYRRHQQNAVCCIIYFTHIPFRHFLNSTQSSFTYNDIQCPHCAKKAFTSAFVAYPPDSDNPSSSAHSSSE